MEAVTIFLVGTMVILTAVSAACWLTMPSRKEPGEASSPHNEEYDRLINRLIDEDKIRLNDRFTVTAGDLLIWVENYPYAYGHPMNDTLSMRLFPSMKTRHRLNAHVGKLAAAEAAKMAGAGR